MPSPALDTPDLFSPIRLGAIELPNRIIMAPMTRNRAGAGNVPTPLMAEYYAQRASAGLIVTEGVQVSPEGVGYPFTPGIHTDDQVAGWRRITRAVHAHGGRILLQLWHVGRISHPTIQPEGRLPVAPSAIAPRGEIFTTNGLLPFETPRALATEEISGVVEQFAAGAERARDAGFDGVEIHAASGYLVDQFLRDGANRRSDAYGGSIENRARFLLEVTGAVVQVWGSGRVGVRLSPANPFNDMADSDPAATFTHAASALNRFDLAYLHVVEEIDEGPPTITPLLRDAYRGALIVNGGYGRETGDRAIASGLTDAVSFAASFLANPDLPRRLFLHAPLNSPDPATFYGGDHRGFTDYPLLEALEVVR